MSGCDVKGETPNNQQANTQSTGQRRQTLMILLCLQCVQLTTCVQIKFFALIFSDKRPQTCMHRFFLIERGLAKRLQVWEKPRNQYIGDIFFLLCSFLASEQMGLYAIKDHKCVPGHLSKLLSENNVSWRSFTLVFSAVHFTSNYPRHILETK